MPLALSRRSLLLIAGPLVIAVVGVVLLVGGATRDAVTTAAAAPAAARTLDYGALVTRYDDGVEELLARTVREPRSWLAWEYLGRTYRTRAQLTGDQLDYTRAQEALARAFAIAPAGAGPFLARAQLNGSLHRDDLIPADLERAAAAVLVDDRTAAAIASLRATCAFHAGHYAEARAGYRRAMTLHPDHLALVALADLDFATGQREQAFSELAEAERGVDRADTFGWAWLAVQRGWFEQERGAWDAALTWYREGERRMPGWWQAEARSAGVLSHRGEHAAALAAYRGLVARTGRIDLMDSLALELRATGDEAGARTWSERAGAACAAMLAEFPEAGCAHALTHALTVAQDPGLAMDLARRNVSLRPGGEALVLLARACVLAGDWSGALTAADGAQAGGWDSADLHEAAARAAAELGDAPRAQRERATLHLLDPGR